MLRAYPSTTSANREGASGGSPCAARIPCLASPFSIPAAGCARGLGGRQPGEGLSPSSVGEISIIPELFRSSSRRRLQPHRDTGHKSMFATRGEGIDVVEKRDGVGLRRLWAADGATPIPAADDRGASRSARPAARPVSPLPFAPDPALAPGSAQDDRGGLATSSSRPWPRRQATTRRSRRGVQAETRFRDESCRSDLPCLT